MMISFLIVILISYKMLLNLEVLRWVSLKKGGVDQKVVKIEKNKMIQTLLMMNIYKLTIKLVTKKEEEVVQKALKIRKKRWVNNY